MATCCGTKSDEDGLFAWFDGMIGHCHQYAVREKAAGRRIVGILCEYTPREIIMAAGGVPVCLCGGSAKTIPAAEQELPANLCPLIKSTYGYHVLGSNPFLEMADLIVGETTCDGKKKMYERLAESRPMYVLQLPYRSEGAEALDYWLGELRHFRAFLADRFQTDVSDDRLREAICRLNEERRWRREITALMRCDRPALSGRRILDCKSSIWAMSDAHENYRRILEAFRGRSGGSCGRVRVLMTGVPMVHGAERVLDLVEQSGGLVVVAENCTGVKPLLEDVDEGAADPLRALAEKYFHLPCSVMSPNDRRLDALGRLASEYRVECVVELVWQACLTYSVESHRVRRFVEKQLGLPYLSIETDYSPSDSARIGVRVEALFETVRARRGSNRCSP
ncbi:MAG: 2-hydroxyacyl-CoA dehydratase family protein [Planctomycetaceae bacterium]|nr:2-hydroxyacyl-CoA dehydratase family protein [Planctomycetaceae bacterium]